MSNQVHRVHKVPMSGYVHAVHFVHPVHLVHLCTRIIAPYVSLHTGLRRTADP